MSVTATVILTVSAFVVGYLVGAILLPIRKTKNIDVIVNVDEN